MKLEGICGIIMERNYYGIFEVILRLFETSLREIEQIANIFWLEKVKPFWPDFTEIRMSTRENF